MKICSIGGITQDSFLWYEAEQKIISSLSNEKCLSIKFGEKIDLENLAHFLGGGAANSAINFSYLGHEAHLIASYGNDEAGNFILSELKKHAVNRSFLIKHPTEPSGTSYVLYNQCHDRIIFVHRGANSCIEQEHFPFDALQNFDLLYITSIRQNRELFANIITEAKKYKIPIAINPGSTQLSTGSRELCKSLHAVSILILNRSEAYTFLQAINSDQEIAVKEKSFPCPTSDIFSITLNPDDPSLKLTDFFSTMLTLGPEIVVVTDGSCGVYVATKTELWHHKAIDVDVVDTVGAGDAFGSTFVETYLQTKDVLLALKGGMYQSASIIQKMGASNGLLKKTELNAALATLSDSLHKHQKWKYQESIDQQ